jgi:putative DNA primase/helicase
LVAAAYTIVRHYLAAGAPKVCARPIGSYGDWSRLVRSPLVFLGECDPVESQSEIRDADPFRERVRGFVTLWLDYNLGLDNAHTVARIVELACQQPPGSGFNFQPPRFKDFLLNVAKGNRGGGEISHEKLGWWLKRVSGQPVEVASGSYRLIAGKDSHSKIANYTLTRI